MFICSIAFDIFKHWGNWFVFSIFLGFQIAMLFTINSYFQNKNMSIGVVSLPAGSNQTSRKTFFLTAIFAYLFLFVL